MTGYYRIAGKTIKIQSVYENVQEHCRAYLTSEQAPDIDVRITMEDLEHERAAYAKMAEKEGIPDRGVSDSSLEILAVYRQIAEKIPSFDCFLMHGSTIAVDGAGYMFTARSGTGKSTHTRLWRELLGERAMMVNDDKPLIRIDENGNAIAYGTPWNGKHKLGSNTAVPLQAVCILERSSENRIREISKTEAYPMLLQQIYRPADPVMLKKTLELIDRMQVKYYRMGCNMELSAAQMAYEAMSRKTIHDGGRTI